MTHATTTWTNPDVCPFCAGELADPGEGFITHVGENVDCERAFDDWRENVTGDVGGGWIS